MTPKDTAIATVEKFFKHLGCKVQVDDYWDNHGVVDGIMHDYQGPYTIGGSSFRYSPDNISVDVYDLDDNAERESILHIRSVTPELAARFTREAITAYEQDEE